MDQDKLIPERWPTASILIPMLREQINKRFAVVSLLGMAIDLLVFRVLFAVGANTDLSQMASFFSGAIFNFGLNACGPLAQPRQAGSPSSWTLCSRFLIVSILALFLRSAVFLLLVTNWHWQPQMAVVVAILAGAAVLFIGTAVFVFSESMSSDVSARWRIVTIAVLAYALLLRLAFLGIVNLIPEEAYYWNYAQHLDLSLSLIHI